MIKIDNFAKIVTETGADLTSDVEIDGAKTSVTFKITADGDPASKIVPNPLSFLLGMLVPAMERGEDIHVGAAIDSELLHRLNTYVISLLNSKNAAYKLITVTCDEPLSYPALGIVPLGALTGMSCGVDSLRTQMVYGGGDPTIPARYQLKTMAVFDVGAFFDPTTEYPRILAKAHKVAAGSDCRALGVSSDFGRFYSGAFADSCTMRHVACAYSLVDLIDVYLVSSTYPWDVIAADGTAPTAMEALDPILLPLLSSQRLEMFSACADEGRHDKVLDLIANSSFLSSIDICTRPVSKRSIEKNCGTCMKCGDFLLAAEEVDKLDLVAPYFDMESFEKRRFRIFQRIFTDMAIMKKRYPLLARDGKKERALSVPFGAYFVGTAVGKITVLLQSLRLIK